MFVVSELIRNEENGSLSFGDHSLSTKSKIEGFENNGNLYKVKTFKELTKLERDGAFVYESEPGTSVKNFTQSADGVTFTVCGDEDAMVTVGLMEDTEYNITVKDKVIGTLKTNLSGKLSFSVELQDEGEIEVKIVK